jgi:menaquinone-dependent protoporphyrinogen oxidase
MAEEKILVAYATRYGSTREIAEEIAEVLGERDYSTDVVNVMDVSDVSAYAGIVIGSPIYMGKWLHEAVDFVKVNQDALRQMPVVVFAAGFSMKDPTEKNREKARASITAIRPYVHPLDIGIFAGTLTLEGLSESDAQIIKMAGAEGGDFRDWDEISAWAIEIESFFKPDSS